MPPEQTTPPTPPVQPPLPSPATPPPPVPVKDNSARLIHWGWFLTLAIPVAILGFAVVNLIISATNSEGGTLQAAANTIIFLVGAAGVLGWPAGIIMLVLGYHNRRKNRAQPGQ